MQRELEQTFDAEKVPAEFREVAHWAARYGIGDDPCRALIMSNISREDRKTMIAEVDRHADAIQKWLDSFGPKMATEAGAFLYLLEGLEEIR